MEGARVAPGPKFDAHGAIRRRVVVRALLRAISTLRRDGRCTSAALSQLKQRVCAGDSVLYSLATDSLLNADDPRRTLCVELEALTNGSMNTTNDGDDGCAIQDDERGRSQRSRISNRPPGPLPEFSLMTTALFLSIAEIARLGIVDRGAQTVLGASTLVRWLTSLRRLEGVDTLEQLHLADVRICRACSFLSAVVAYV